MSDFVIINHLFLIAKTETHTDINRVDLEIGAVVENVMDDSIQGFVQSGFVTSSSYIYSMDDNWHVYDLSKMRYFAPKFKLNDIRDVTDMISITPLHQTSTKNQFIVTTGNSIYLAQMSNEFIEILHEYTGKSICEGSKSLLFISLDNKNVT